MKSINLASKIYEAFAAGSVDGLTALCTPDIEWIQNEGFPYGGNHRGAAAVLEGVRNTLDRYWDGFAFTRHEAYDSGQIAIVIGVYSGTHKITGLPVRADAVHILEFEDGLLRRFRQFTDTKLFHDAVVAA